MSECDFCPTGVPPFYTLDGTSKDGKASTICHTCFHLGKHLVKLTKITAARETAESGSTTSTKR